MVLFNIFYRMKLGYNATVEAHKMFSREKRGGDVSGFKEI